MPDPEQFMTTLERMSVFETSFTPEQREQLAERRAALGPEAIEAAKTEWAGLVEHLLRHVQDGTPVDDPRVQDLTGRGTRWRTTFTPKAPTVSGPRPLRSGCGTRTAKRSGNTLPWPADRMRELVHYLERAREAR